jgi:cytochrome b
MNAKTQVLIWDLPTRIFHWLLTGSFAAAAVLAFLTEDRSSLFPYHALFGLVLALMVALRVVWGFIGTRHARFASFSFSPKAVLVYLKGVVTLTGPRHIGHNPGSAYAIFAMLFLLAGIGITGIVLGTGNRAVEEPHEVMANLLLVVVGIHVLGVIVHTIRFRENIIGAMFTGRKEAEITYAIPSARAVAAVLFVVLVSVWAVALFKNYDAGAKSFRLPVVGKTLHIGETAKERRVPVETER